MPIYKQLPRSKPKVSDEFKTILEHAFHWVNVNWKIVLSAIASIGIVAIIILIAVNFSSSRSEKASELLFMADSKAGAERETALEDVFKKYPSSKLAAIARLKVSDIYYSRGEYIKTVETLQPIENFKVPETRLIAMHNIAAAKLALNDWKAAAEYYLKAYDDPKNRAKSYSYFNAGLSYSAGGQVEEAKKIFNDIILDETVNPSLKQKAKEQAIWLSIKK